MEGSARIQNAEVLDLLAGLVQKSLVVYEEDEQGRGRYRLLETVRQYSRDRLLEDGETEAVRGRHLSFYVDLGDTAEPQLLRREQLPWLDRLESEIDNLRAALEWSLESDAEGGARLAAALLWFWFFRSYWREGSHWSEGLVLAEPVGERFLQGVPLANLGESALYRHEFIPARALLKRGLMLNLELGQKGLIAHFLEVIAAVIGATGQPHSAVRLLAAAEALRQSLRGTIESHEQRYHHLRVMMARAGLGEAEYAAAWAEGQAMSLDAAVAFALDERHEG